MNKEKEFVPFCALLTKEQKDWLSGVQKRSPNNTSLNVILRACINRTINSVDDKYKDVPRKLDILDIVEMLEKEKTEPK